MLEAFHGEAHFEIFDEKVKMNPYRLKNPKYIYFVYVAGTMDFCTPHKKTALEMAIHPATGSRDGFTVQRWVLTIQNTYKFDEELQ